MTAKQYLSQIRRLDIQIGQRREELDRLHSAAQSVSVHAGDARHSFGGSDRVGDTAARLCDLEAEINKDVQVLAELRHKIINQIQRLGDTRHVDLLYRRYVNYQSWEEISDSMYYTVRHVQRLHGSALQEFARCNPNMSHNVIECHVCM